MNRNRYNAYRIQGGVDDGKWVGWMTYAGSPRNVVETPGRYPSRAAAVAAIKGQHP
jgi:hypothetical protein